MATPYLTGAPVWGATFDNTTGDRVLFTTEGSAYAPGAGGPIPESTPVPFLGGIWSLLLIVAVASLGVFLVARRTG